MANNRHRRLMQEALDDQLDSEALHSLDQILQDEPATSSEFDRLQAVDHVLKSAGHERAPEGFALKLMARLAEGIDLKELPKMSSPAVALALALVTLILLPVLTGIGWLIFNAVGNTGILNSMIELVANMLTNLMSSFSSLSSSAQQLLTTYPEAPLVLAVLAPLSVFWLYRFAAQNRPKE